jgi:hypothetical protein
VTHPTNPTRDYDPGNGQGYWFYLNEKTGYWGYDPTDGYKKFIPPRPATFQGDEASWLAYVMWGLEPKYTQRGRGPMPFPIFALCWGIAGFLSVKIFFSIVGEDVSAGGSNLVAVACGAMCAVIAPLTRRFPKTMIGILAGLTILDFFRQKRR